MKSLLLGVAIASLALVSCKNTESTMNMEAGEAPAAATCPMGGGGCEDKDAMETKECSMDAGMEKECCEGCEDDAM